MPEFLAHSLEKYPAAVWGTFTVLVWLGQYLVRRYAPTVWRAGALLALRDQLVLALPPELLPKLLPVIQLAWTTWQALPSLLAGALFSAWQSGGSFEEAWKGAAITALAPVLHHFRRALPFDPYQGELGKPPRTPVRLSDRPPSIRTVPPPSGPSAAALLLLAGALLFTGPTACASGPNIPLPTDGAAAREAARGAFAGAVLAVRATDELAATWFRSVANPTPADIEKATAVTGALVAARDALKLAEPCIKDGGDCVEKLRVAVDQLTFATELLASLGRPPPDELLTVLKFLRGYVNPEVKS